MRHARPPGLLVALCLGAALLPCAAFARDAPTRIVAWRQIESPVSPPARENAAMAYDEVSQRIILFGGQNNGGTLGDTWAFDGEQWAPSEGESPPPRFFPAMAYDAVHGNLVLFGGQEPGGVYVRETWLFNGRTLTWKKVHADNRPPGRSGAAMFTDPATGYATLFGGAARIGPLNDLWQFDGHDWHPLNPGTLPSARSGAAVGYDEQTGQVIIGSGCTEIDAENGTWIWDGVVFSQVPIEKGKPQRCHSSSGYSPATQSVVMFGGGTGNEAFTDVTFAFTGAKWNRPSSDVRPPARREGMAAYHKAAKALFIFGGRSSWLDLLGDTWQLGRPQSDQ